MTDNEKMTGKMESHFEKHGKAHCITRLQVSFVHVRSTQQNPFRFGLNFILGSRTKSA